MILENERLHQLNAELTAHRDEARAERDSIAMSCNSISNMAAGIFREINELAEQTLGHPIESGHTAVYAVELLAERLAAVEAERDGLRIKAATGDQAICQILGRVLGCPECPDDPTLVDTGDRTAVSIAAEAAEWIVMVEAERDKARAERDEAREEVERLKSRLRIYRRIVVNPLDSTASEVEALEPIAACEAIDLWNLKSSNVAGARINRELRIERNKLRAERNELIDVARELIESTDTEMEGPTEAAVVDGGPFDRLKALVRRAAGLDRGEGA